MLDLEFVRSFVHENFSHVSVSRNGTHFNFRCPFCGDSEKSKRKKRFHLQYNNDESTFFNCFNCPATGTFYDLYAHMEGISSSDAYKKLRKFDCETVKKSLVQKSTYKEKTIDYTKHDNFNDFLKNNCLSLESIPTSYYQSKLIEYLKFFKESRQITTELFVCHSGIFEKRIIIPIIENGVCVYFQGRRILETQYPKYLNPSVEKENVILNIRHFNPEKFIIVTEGILDADAIGYQGTTCLGASIDDIFLSELYKYTNKGIILALDNDKAGQDQIQKIFKESKFNKKLLYFTLDTEKDLNEFKVNFPDVDVYKYVKDSALTYLEAYTQSRIRGNF